ncbi:MAG: hypothetical protein ABJA49_12175, partial [Betaproteobacteria bacterium]
NPLDSDCVPGIIAIDRSIDPKLQKLAHDDLQNRVLARHSAPRPLHADCLDHHLGHELAAVPVCGA